VIKDDIDDFYPGKKVSGLDIEIAPDSPLAYSTPGAIAFEYYNVDPLVFDYTGINKTMGSDVQFIVGEPKANGSNPKINASLIIQNGAKVVIQNVDIVPDVAVCKETFSLTGSAIRIGDPIGFCGDGGVLDEYAGVVIKGKAWLEMYDVTIDVSNAAALSATVGDEELFAQVDEESAPLYGLYSELNDGDPDNYLYLDDVKAFNENGKYGLAMDLKEANADFYTIQIIGGDYSADEASIYLNVTDAAPKLDVSTLPEAAALLALGGDPVTGVAISLPDYIINQGDPVDVRGEAGSENYINTILGELDSRPFLVGDTFEFSKMTTTSAILYPTITFVAWCWEENFGLEFEDLTIDAEELIGWANLTELGLGKIEEYPGIKAAVLYYAEKKALMDALLKDIDETTVGDEIIAQMNDGFDVEVDDLIDADVAEQIEEILGDVFEAHSAGGQAKVKTAVRAAIVEVPELEIARVGWGFDYEYEYEYSRNWEFVAEGVFKIKVLYDNPLFYITAPLGTSRTELLVLEDFLVKKSDGGKIYERNADPGSILEEGFASAGGEDYTREEFIDEFFED